MSVEIKGLKELEEKLANIKENLKFFDTHTIGVGIPQEQNASVDGGMNMATLAMIHEHGKGNQPERSFLRAAIRENRQKNETFLFNEAINKLDEKGSVELAMKKLALSIQADSQEIIGSDEKLKPLLYESYANKLRRKGLTPPPRPNKDDPPLKTKPLFDDGNLRKAIRGVVQKK